MKTKTADNIKYYRKLSGMTQTHLAAKLCVEKSIISKYENGRSTPDIYTLCKLADIFGITLDELVEWSDE